MPRMLTNAAYAGKCYVCNGKGKITCTVCSGVGWVDKVRLPIRY